MNNNFILSPSEIEAMYRNMMINGIPSGINCGVEDIDECFRLDRGKLVVVTGIPTMGKSEFVDFLCVQYNKLHGMKTLYFSPENQPLPLHINKLFNKIEGVCFKESMLDDKHYTDVRKYIYENFLFFNYSREYSIQDVLDTAEKYIYASGVDILVMDSYNKLLHDTSRNETEIIGRELDLLERFAKRLNIIIILVAHPKKMDRKGEGRAIPDAYDINGSANFYNKADYVLVVHRDEEQDCTILNVDKVKFKNYGAKGVIHLAYDGVSGNYYEKTITLPFDDNGFVKTPKFEVFDLNTHKKSGDKWLNVTCSCANRVWNTETTQCNLWKFLTHTTEDLQNSLAQIRTTTGKERQDLKTKLLPIVTPSVVVNGKRNSEHIRGYTNIMCLDIDKKDNPNIGLDAILDKLKKLPYVAVAQKSASGEGYCVFVPVKDGRNHIEHFLALEEEFAEMGITIDKACKDAVRARYYSFDAERYVNPSCSVYVKRVLPQSKVKSNTETTSYTTPSKYSTPTISRSDLVTELNQQCSGVEELNVCPTHQAWVEVGSALVKELGEDGRTFFHRLSQGYPQYNEDETNYKYDELLQHANNYGYNKGTIFHYINQAKS
jgi:KaiC/GvpD/RAD55 family RecA-like ATPase